MGVFSEIAMEQQNGMFDSSAAFEDDEAFELEEMESLPVPPVGTDTVPVSAASVCAGETALADAEEEPADEVAPAGEEKSAEEGNSAQPPAAEDEEKKRAEHEVAEAQRKAEFDAKQQAKKAAEQEQIARLEAMSDEEVIAASTQRVSTDVEKLTRRNMKECVSEHIQMLCMEPALVPDSRHMAAMCRMICAISGRKIISVTLMPRKTMRMRRSLFPSRMLESLLQRANPRRR